MFSKNLYLYDPAWGPLNSAPFVSVCMKVGLLCANWLKWVIFRLKIKTL